MTEADIQRSIQIEATKLGARLFRNSVGLAWIGVVTHCPGDRVIIDHARPVHFGLAVGSADLIGYVPTVIGNHRVALFASCEVKTKRGRMTAEQDVWREQVAHNGGLGLVSRSVDEFKLGLKQFVKQF